MSHRLAGLVALFLVRGLSASMLSTAPLAVQRAGGVIEGYVRTPCWETDSAVHPIKARVEVGGTFLTTFTDSAGFYRFVEVPPGPVRLRIVAAGHRPGRVDELVLREGESVRRDVELVPISFEVLDPTVLGQDVPRGFILGTVRTATGTPIPRARVQLVGTGAFASTDSLGRYRLGAVAPGRYEIRAVQLGHGPSLMRDVHVADGATVIRDFALEVTPVSGGCVMAAPAADGTRRAPLRGGASGR